MTLYKFSWVVLHCWVLSLLLFKARGEGSEISVNFSEAPNPTSRLNSARFSFDVWVDGQKVSVGENAPPCTGYNMTCPCPESSNITCKMDNGITTDCGGKVVSYTGLQEGNHKFEVCSVSSPAVLCSTYTWIVDTVPPTAYITSPSSFTRAMNVSVNISFTEPCTGEDGKDGFKCSENACNLLVHGYGQVIPSSLATLVPSRKYTLLVGFSPMVENGTATLEMDNIACTDTAGNKFMKAENSTFNISFDRRSAVANLILSIPQKFLPNGTGNMSVIATNKFEDLKVYLNFSEPVLNSTAQVLSALNTSQGTLLPITGENLGNRTFGFEIVNVPDANYAMIDISFDSKSIITKPGNPISPIEPLTILYDSRRPEVILKTTSRRLWRPTIPIFIGFLKPVLGFNEYSINVSGGRLQSFSEESPSAIYFIRIQADEDFVFVTVPENVTEDVSGNKNQASALQLRYCKDPRLLPDGAQHPADGADPGNGRPTLPRVLSTFVTTTFGITCAAHGVLAVSSASLVSTGTISGGYSSFISGPATNLMLSLGHIQLIALSRWLPVYLPAQYYEYAKALEWSIPYFKLPWEKKDALHDHVHAKADSDTGVLDVCPNFTQTWENFQRDKTKGPEPDLDESKIVSTIIKIAGSIFFDKCQQLEEGWIDFFRSIFWLAVIGISLILLHAVLILIIKIRWPQKDRDYGVLAFPRFEIFLIIVALPCISKASTGLIKESKGSGDIVGGVLMGVVGLILVAFFIFLLVGATLGMLLLYREKSDSHGEAHEQPKPKLCLRIGRKTLGPRLKGEWTWKNQSTQVYVKIFGPLFEDLRGHMPPQSNSQNHGDDNHLLPQGNPQNHGDDKTRDAEAPSGNPFISKHGDPRNSSNNEIEDLEAQVNPQNHGDDETRAEAPGGNPSNSKHGDRSNSSNNEIEDLEAQGNPQNHGDDETRAEAPGGNPSNSKHGDRSNSSNNEIEDLEAQGNPQNHGDDDISAEAPGGYPSNSKHGDRTISSNDEMEDLEAQGNTHIHGDDETQNAEAPGANPSNSKHIDHTISYNDEMEDVEPPGSNSHKSDDGITGDIRAPGAKANPGSNGDDITSSVDKKVDVRTHGSNVLKNNVDHKREGARGLGGNPANKHSDPNITEDASFIEKLFGILRTYYTLLETVRVVILGILAGLFTVDDGLAKSPTIFMLCITGFLLLFLLYLKPFVSKRGLVVEIIAIVCEVGVFSLSLLILVTEPSQKEKQIIDKWMFMIPFMGYLAAMINEFYALYRQIKKLDRSGSESFVEGLEDVFFGFVSFYLPRKLMEKFGDNFSQTGPGREDFAETASIADQNRSSTTTDEPGMKQPSKTTKSKSFPTASRDEKGMKQPSEPTKSKSFPSLSKQASRGPNVPSSGNASAPPPSELGRY